MSRGILSAVAAVCVLGAGVATGQDRIAVGRERQDRATVKRVLLVGQGPDNHPFGAHEYMAGVHVLAKCLQPVDGIQTIITRADEPWTAGPELLDGADAAVVFVSEGAKWLDQDPARRAAFRRLAERGGGLVVLHWGMGCREAQHINGFVQLFGACHGGPDRKFKVLTATIEPASGGHPILSGIRPLRVHDEFYYRLKTIEPNIAGDHPITPLLRVPIDGETHMVAWAWDRPDGGRSAGFSGAHFHENWKHQAYRRLLAQAVLWTAKLPIPDDGLSVEITEQELQLEPRADARQRPQSRPANN